MMSRGLGIKLQLSDIIELKYDVQVSYLTIQATLQPKFQLRELKFPLIPSKFCNEVTKSNLISNLSNLGNLSNFIMHGRERSYHLVTSWPQKHWHIMAACSKKHSHRDGKKIPSTVWWEKRFPPLVGGKCSFPFTGNIKESVGETLAIWLKI